MVKDTQRNGRDDQRCIKEMWKMVKDTPRDGRNDQRYTKEMGYIVKDTPRDGRNDQRYKRKFIVREMIKDAQKEWEKWSKIYKRNMCDGQRHPQKWETWSKRHKTLKEMWKMLKDTPRDARYTKKWERWSKIHKEMG